MDKPTAKLVADLAHQLCLELDLNYSDIQLAKYNQEAVDTVSAAMMSLLRAKAPLPKILEHVVRRGTRGAQHLKTLDDGPSA